MCAAQRDSFEELTEFIDTVSTAGVTSFVIHARKAILGLNTKDNRSVPPLRHEWVDQLATKFPELTFELNGGIRDLSTVVTVPLLQSPRPIGQVEAKLNQEPQLQGCMIGREA